MTVMAIVVLCCTILAMYPIPSFPCEHLIEFGNEIEKEIENMFDMKIKVKFITNDIEKNKPESEIDNNPKSKQADDKVFDKIVDLFDGEIIH